MASPDTARPATAETVNGPRNGDLLGRAVEQIDNPSAQSSQGGVISLVVSPAGAGLFAARLDGSNEILCVSNTPLFSACRVLLARGLAKPDDVVVMRHVGADAIALRARVRVAAGLTVEDRPSGQKIGLAKYRPRTNAVTPRIARTASPVPDQPRGQIRRYGDGGA